MSAPERTGRGGRTSRPLAILVAAVLGIGALGGATGAVLGGVSLAAAEIEQSEHGAGRDGDDAVDRLRDDPRSGNERGEPAPVAPAPVAPVPPRR